MRTICSEETNTTGYIEIQRAFIAHCWKSVIILSGGAIEAILMDLLLQKQSAALAATKAPKGKSDISRWDLAGFDHGVGHPLQLLYDTKAPRSQNSN